MINTIIFDLGNVLVAFDWQKSLHSYGFSDEKFETIANAVYRNSDWNEMDRGVLTVEEVTNRFICHAPQYADDIRLLIDEIDKPIYSFPYTKPMLQKIKDAGLKVYYLSNFGKYGFEKSRHHLDFMSMMDGGILSYEVEMIKPNPWIFAELFKRYQINPKEAVFFDDNPANVAAAQSIGLQAEVFISPDQVQKYIPAL